MQCNDSSLAITMDIAGCRAASIGEYGLSDKALKHWIAEVAPHFEALKAACAAGKEPLFAAWARTDDIVEAENTLKRLSFGARDLLFFGIGGSSA